MVKNRGPKEHIRSPEDPRDVLCGRPTMGPNALPPIEYPRGVELPPEGPDQCGSCWRLTRRRKSGILLPGRW